jgi:hypothetical protein
VIDVSRLGDWMDGAALPGKGEPVQARFLSGGGMRITQVSSPRQIS